MPRRKGDLGRTTIEVKHAVEQAFKTVNGKRNGGLIKLAEVHPKIFYSLVAKCIPTQIAADITHTVIDLGAAMREANQRLEHMSTLIDVTPASEAPGPVAAPDPVTVDSTPQTPQTPQIDDDEA